MSLEAHCHCGSSRIAVPKISDRVATCNCSWCARTGAVWGYYKPEEVEILSSQHDRVYDPNDTNRHHFCGKCSGIMYNDSPEWDLETYEPTGNRIYSVNLRMIDDIDLGGLSVSVIDGKSSW